MSRVVRLRTEGVSMVPEEVLDAGFVHADIKRDGRLISRWFRPGFQLSAKWDDIVHYLGKFETSYEIVVPCHVSLSVNNHSKVEYDYQVGDVIAATEHPYEEEVEKLLSDMGVIDKVAVGVGGKFGGKRG